MSRAEERCPSCGALVSADADWCGQCFASLRVQAGAAGSGVPAARGSSDLSPSAGAPGGGEPAQTAEVGGPAPTWPCGVCDSRNPIDADTCAFCGARFGEGLGREAAERKVQPMSAFTRSLIFPGLGHKIAGRGLEGVTRAVLFIWTAGTAAMLWFSGSREDGAGGGGPMIVLFATAALVVYALTSIDAYRAASGDRPVLPPRVWLWMAAALVMISALLAALAMAGASRAR